MRRLGVNIDHVATLRNARGEKHPDPLDAARFVKKVGADSVTIHLREDRRHINDIDTRIASFQSGADIINSDNVPEDDDGHGTHVAGIIGAQKTGYNMHGVAYDAILYPIRIMTPSLPP